MQQRSLKSWDLHMTSTSFWEPGKELILFAKLTGSFPRKHKSRDQFSFKKFLQQRFHELSLQE